MGGLAIPGSVNLTGQLQSLVNAGELTPDLQFIIPKNLNIALPPGFSVGNIPIPPNPPGYNDVLSPQNSWAKRILIYDHFINYRVPYLLKNKWFNYNPSTDKWSYQDHGLDHATMPYPSAMFANAGTFGVFPRPDDIVLRDSAIFYTIRVFNGIFNRYGELSGVRDTNLSLMSNQSGESAAANNFANIVGPAIFAVFTVAAGYAALSADFVSSGVQGAEAATAAPAEAGQAAALPAAGSVGATAGGQSTLGSLVTTAEAAAGKVAGSVALGYATKEVSGLISPKPAAPPTPPPTPTNITPVVPAAAQQPGGVLVLGSAIIAKLFGLI